MIVEAYKCDYCNIIQDAEYMTAVNPVEDLFDHSKSYPSHQTLLHKYPVHFCLECYRVNVLIPVENKTNRKKDEAAYQSLLKDFTFIFKKSCVIKHNAAKAAGKRKV